MGRTIKVMVAVALMMALTATVALAATRYGTSGPDNIVGTAYGDALYGGDDLIWGGGGNDNPGFQVGPNAKGLYGGAGHDAIHGDNLLVGGAGGDLLSGGAGNDQIGSPGDGTYDKIYCGDGSDFVEAGYGDYVAPTARR